MASEWNKTAYNILISEGSLVRLAVALASRRESAHGPEQAADTARVKSEVVRSGRVIVEKGVDDKENGISVILILPLRVGGGVAREVLTELGQLDSLDGV